jgi:hypothetical protein
MDFDLEHDVMNVATELCGLALNETATFAQYQEAVDHALSDVLQQHPNFPVELFAFAMGRALGRLEGQRAAAKR